mgnify:FL=1
MGEWWEERTIGEKVVMVIGMALLGIGALFLFGLIVMWLWNWLMPEIFGLPEITYWQGWGLLVLSCILFKDIGSGSNEGGRSERKRKRKLREYMEEEQFDSGSQSATESPAGEGETQADAYSSSAPDGAPSNPAQGLHGAPGTPAPDGSHDAEQDDGDKDTEERDR